MFTGIIEEVGTIKTFQKTGSAAMVTVEAHKILKDIKVGDSVAVNGVCLTVTEFGDKYFKAAISEETLSVTKFSGATVNEKVNLERALKLTDRLSGHIVTGHIDCIGFITEKVERGDFTIFFVSFDGQFSKYVIKKGSIAIDGISLTVNEIDKNIIRLNIIPHTIKTTNLQFATVSTKVNIEFDIIGKYVEKLINAKDNTPTLSVDLLKKAGFLGGTMV